MESVRMTRLPPLNIRFEVGGISEPPERSWARIRTYLIDNPKDDGLSRRQEVWSYHRKNRGVLKSLVKNLPHVPFRVRKGRTINRKLNDGLELRDTRTLFPKLQIGSDKQVAYRNSRLRPLGALNKTVDVTENEKGRNGLPPLKEKAPDENDESEKAHDGNDDDSSLQELEIPELRHSPGVKNSLKGSKRVSYSMNDIHGERCESRETMVSTGSSVVSDSAIEHYGPSSQPAITPSIPKSLLNMIHGSHLADPRVMTDRNKKVPIASVPTKQTVTVTEGKAGASLLGQGKTTSTNVFPSTNWFESVLSEKVVIDVNAYDNFTRTPRVKAEAETPAPVIPERRQKPYVPNTQKIVLPSAPKVSISNTPKPQPVVSSRVSSEAPVERKVVKQMFDSTNTKPTVTLAEKIKSVGNTQKLTTVKKITSEIQIMQSDSVNNNPVLPNIKQESRPPVDDSHLKNGVSSPTLSYSSADRDSKLGIRSPPVSSPKLIGEPIAPAPKSNSPATTPRYFPIFSSDGTPMRKIGGPTKKRHIKITFPNSTMDEAPTGD